MKFTRYPHSLLTSRRRQAGLTLVEMSLGIIVVLLVATFLLGGFDIIRERVRAYREISDFPQVLECIKNRKVTSSGFAGTTTTSIMSCFPSGMRSGNTAVNYWSGPVTVAPATTITANDSIAFTSSNYSRSGCTNVPPGLAAVFAVITVNGTQIKSNGNPLDDGAMEAACTGDSNNTITFLALK